MMKNEILRKIDELGRIVIPIEVRKVLNISPGDSVRICVEENHIKIIKVEVAENDELMQK